MRIRVKLVGAVANDDESQDVPSFNSYWWPIRDTQMAVGELLEVILEDFDGQLIEGGMYTARVDGYRLRDHDAVKEVIRENDVLEIIRYVAPGHGTNKTRKRNERRKRHKPDQPTDTGRVLVTEVECDSEFEYEDETEEVYEQNGEKANFEEKNENGSLDKPSIIKWSDSEQCTANTVSPGSLVYIEYMGAEPPSYLPGIQKVWGAVDEEKVDEEISITVCERSIPRNIGRFEAGEESGQFHRNIEVGNISRMLKFGTVVDANYAENGGLKVDELPEIPES